MPLNLPIDIAFRQSDDGLYDYFGSPIIRVSMGRTRETRTDQPRGEIHLHTQTDFGTTSIFEFTMMYWR